MYEQPIAVPDEELPLRLPDMVDFKPGDDPQGCLARAVDWRYFQKDGKWFARETNTMPQVNGYPYIDITTRYFAVVSVFKRIHLIPKMVPFKCQCFFLVRNEI